MQKKTIIAALAAAALTMGFSACNGNNEPDKGDYKLTVNVHADAMGSDGMEFATIYNAYRSAFGLEELNEKTGEEAPESVEITGKDSLACVSAIREKCAQAEAVLQGETWADVNVIAIRDANTNAEIYSKQYGAPAENGYDHAKFDKSLGYLNVEAFFPKTVNAPEENVAYVHIDSRSSTIWHSSELWLNNYVGKDLNYKAGGNYIYPSYSFEQTGPGVKGLLVLKNMSGTKPPATFEFEGHLYMICVDANTEKYSFDLNHKAGGSDLFLYQNRGYGHLLNAGKSEIYWADHDITMEKCNPREERDRFVRGVTLYKDGNLVLTHPNGIDLNEAAGGKYMYWREVYDIVVGDDSEDVDW